MKSGLISASSILASAYTCIQLLTNSSVRDVLSIVKCAWALARCLLASFFQLNSSIFLISALSLNRSISSDWMTYLSAPPSTSSAEATMALLTRMDSVLRRYAYDFRIVMRRFCFSLVSSSSSSESYPVCFAVKLYALIAVERSDDEDSSSASSLYFDTSLYGLFMPKRVSANTQDILPIAFS